MVEWKGSKDLQCSMLSLHFSNLIINVFRIIQKPRQNWSVSAFISQNANVKVCNLTLTDPAHSEAKHLDFCSLSVASFPAVPGCGGSSRIWGWVWLSWACPPPREKCRGEVAQIGGIPKPSSAFCVLTGTPLALPSCCGQIWEAFTYLQKRQFSELQNSP